MSARLPGAVLLAGSMVLAAHSHARAQPASRVLAKLEWSVSTAASRCSDPDPVRSQVEQMLGRRVFARADEDVRVTVRIARDDSDDGWIARVRLLDADGNTLGERTVSKRAPRCESLHGSLSVVLALILDLPRPTGGSPPPLTEGTALSIPEDRSEGGWGFAGAVGAQGTWGLLPGHGLAIQPSLTITPRGFLPVRAVFTHTLTREVEVAGVHAAFDAYAVGLAVCPEVVAGHGLAIDICAGGSLGQLTGTGLDLRVSRRVRRMHAQLDLLAALRIALGGVFEVSLEAGTAVPVLRHQYTVTLDTQTHHVHRPWRLVPVVRVALGVRIGP